MPDSERLAVLEERLKNLISLFQEFRAEDTACFSEFRQEQQAQFDKLDTLLGQHLRDYSTRIRALEFWQSRLMGAWGLAVLLWGGLLAWIKFGQGKS